MLGVINWPKIPWKSVPVINKPMQMLDNKHWHFDAYKQ